MDTWLPAVGKSPAGLLMPLLVSLKTSIMWSTLNLEFSALCCSNLPPAAHLPPGLVSSPLQFFPPITSAQLKASSPSHQPFCLARLWRPALHRSTLVVTLQQYHRQRGGRGGLLYHLRQLEIFLQPVSTFSATQSLPAVSRTQAEPGSAMRKELW